MLKKSTQQSSTSFLKSRIFLFLLLALVFSGCTDDYKAHQFLIEILAGEYQPEEVYPGRTEMLEAKLDFQEGSLARKVLGLHESHYLSHSRVSKTTSTRVVVRDYGPFQNISPEPEEFFEENRSKYWAFIFENVQGERFYAHILKYEGRFYLIEMNRSRKKC